MKTSAAIATALLAGLLWAAPADAKATSAVEGGDAAADLLKRFTAAQLGELLRGARPNRLAREREAVGAEIGAGILFDADKTAAAVAALHADPADTPADNVERITRAFVAVDGRLAEPMALAASGEHARAAAAWAALINADGSSYVDAVKQMARADALAAAGSAKEAAAAYVEIVRRMPEKVSFAATAAIKAAGIYETLGRMVYARQLYQWWLDNCGFLDEAQAAEAAAKVRAIAAKYDNPLMTLAGQMNTVAERLAGADSGPATQRTEQEILAMLNDLIGMAEDQQNDSDGGGGDSSVCPNCGRRCGGTCSGSAAAAGMPATPTTPASGSFLPGGTAAEPTGLSGVRATGEDDGWGKLPPRRREQILETFKQRYPQRYTEMLDAYYRKLSEQK